MRFKASKESGPPMHPQARRVERAEVLLKETLSGYPSGLPAIALVDRLERWGFSENEGSAVLQQLRNEGRIQVVRGHYILSEDP